MSENRMTTDTERGRKLLEARRDRIVTHTNVEPVGTDEFRAFIDLALAACRRRSAEEVFVRDANRRIFADLVSMKASVDAALDALLTHLAGEGA
jgi:hypothetical protein